MDNGRLEHQIKVLGPRRGFPLRCDGEVDGVSERKGDRQRWRMCRGTGALELGETLCAGERGGCSREGNDRSERETLSAMKRGSTG